MDEHRDDFEDDMEKDMVDALDEEAALLADDDLEDDDDEDEDKLLRDFGMSVTDEFGNPEEETPEL